MCRSWSGNRHYRAPVPTPDEFAAMERFRGRCLGLVVRLDGIVASSTLGWAQHLIDHGEAGFAIEYLALGVTEQHQLVSRDVIDDLRDLAASPDDLPRNLDDFVDQ